MELQPIFVAMFVYVFLVKFVPRVITKPTGIDLIDNLVMYIVSNKDSVVPGSMFVGLIVMLSTYINDQLV
jgi:hypothetical protein